MKTTSYQKGNWKADLRAEELASGKYQGVVLLQHEGHTPHVDNRQVEHRAVNTSDTVDEALEEAAVLAQHLLNAM